MTYLFEGHDRVLHNTVLKLILYFFLHYLELIKYFIYYLFNKITQRY